MAIPVAIVISLSDHFDVAFRCKNWWNL